MNCKNCNVQFDEKAGKPSHNKIFCGRVCKDQYRNKTEKVRRPCLYCIGLTNRQKFCSKRCKLSWEQLQRGIDRAEELSKEMLKYRVIKGGIEVVN